MAFIIEIDKDTFELEDAKNVDSIQISDSKFHVLKNNQSYQIEILESDFSSKTMTLEVNGNKYDVTIKDSYDQLVKKLGFASANNQKLKNIKAPMPGLIIDILVESGQSIQKGDPLLILEAMKMENILKAGGEGIIKSVSFTKGMAVDKGQVIIEME